MANLKVGNTNIGKISIIEPFKEIGANPSQLDYQPHREAWVRPTEWLDMPNIGSGDNKVALLMYMHSGVPLEPRIYLRGQYVSNSNYKTYSTIDWGDGQTVIVSGTSHDSNNRHYIRPEHHVYKYEDLPEDSEFTYHGATARQALIQIDNSVSGCYYLELNRLTVNDLDSSLRTNARHGSVRNYQSNNLLDLHVAGQDLQYLYLSNDPDRGNPYQLQRVVLEGDMSLATAYRQFRSCQNLQSISYPSGAWSTATDLREMFAHCVNLKEIPFFDSSNGTNFDSMFARCYEIDSVPDLDTSNGTNFNHTFDHCINLKEIPNFDYSSCTSSRSMFNQCRSIKVIPTGLDFSNTTDTRSMFSRCANVRRMPNDFFETNFANAGLMDNMFYECRKLKNMPRIHFPNATSLREFALRCESLEHIHLGDLSSVDYHQNYGFYYAFGSCFKNKKITVDYPDKFIARNMQGMFSNQYNLEDAPYINTASGVQLRQFLTGCLNMKTAPVYDLTNCTDMNSFYSHCRSLRKIGGFKNASQRITEGSDMFRECFFLSEFPSGLFEDYSSTPSRCQNMFYQTAIKSIPDVNVSGMDTTSTGHSVFYNMTYLDSVGNITVGSGTSLRSLFQSSQKLQRVGYADVSLVTDMTNAFYSCRSLEWVDFSGYPVTVSFYDDFLGSGALKHIFDRLKDGVSGQTIDIRNNYGTYELHADTIAIATNKGWTVTT